MDPQLTQILVQIVLAVSAVVVPTVATFLVTYIRSKTAQLEKMIPASELALAKNISTEAVQAAEVAGANEYIASKEQYAIKYATDYLSSKGIVFPVATLEGLVKSAFLTAISPTSTLPEATPTTPSVS